MLNNQINCVAINTPFYLPKIKNDPAVIGNRLVKESSVNMATSPADSFVVDAQIPTTPAQVRSGRDYKLKGVRGFFAILSTAVLATGAVFAHFKQQSTTSLKKEVGTVLPKPVLNPEMVDVAVRSIGCTAFRNEANTGERTSLGINTVKRFFPIDELPAEGHIPFNQPATIAANKTDCERRLAFVTGELMQKGSVDIPKPADIPGKPTLKLELIPQPTGEAKIRLIENGESEELPTLMPIKKDPETMTL